MSAVTLNEQITALWNDGMSALLIAEKLGVTRNTICGRIYRMQLPPRPTTNSGDGRVHHPKLRRGSHMDGAIASGLKARSRKRRANGHLEMRTAPLPVLPALDTAHAVRFADAGPHQCRFIAAEEGKHGADTLVCGAPVAGASSYCEFHRRIAFTQSNPRDVPESSGDFEALA